MLLRMRPKIRLQSILLQRPQAVFHFALDGGVQIRSGTDSIFVISVFFPPSLLLTLSWRRLGGEAALLTLHLFEQAKGTVEEEAGVPIRDLPAQQGLHSPQPIVRLLADRELHAVPLRRQRLDHRPLEYAFVPTAVVPASRLLFRGDGFRRTGLRPAVTCGGGGVSGHRSSTGATRSGAKDGAGPGYLPHHRRDSGLGASSAIKASICSLFRWAALWRTASWFSGVRWFRSFRTDVRVSRPAARRSTMTGNRLQARAASMRLQAASSESPRAPTQ